MKKLTSNRRTFLKSLLVTGVSTPAVANAWFDFNWLSTNKDTYVSAQGRQHFGLSWFSDHSKDVNSSPTGFRGHGISHHPLKPHQVVMIARRPGTQGVVQNLNSKKINAVFNCSEDNHMQGHGCFSEDGRLFYTSESNIINGKGKIVVRETNNYQIIKEFDSHGIGPHEIALMPDNKTLVVANGGLLTHPYSGRKVLNLETMAPSLCYINSANGTLLSKHVLPETKASIRHLDVIDDGTVAIALQIQRSAMNSNTLVPLAAIHKPGQEIEMLSCPEPLLQQLNDYMGSVKINAKTRIAAFTSPKGNLAMFWDIDTYAFQNFHAFHDVCGLSISSDNKYFVLSNSNGKIRKISASSLEEDKSQRLHFSDANWDNHMLTVAPST